MSELGTMHTSGPRSASREREEADVDATPLEDAHLKRARTLNWLPFGSGIEAVPAGVFWNAVVVSRTLGEALLPMLGEYTGAVIEDVPAGKLYWLIPPGAGTWWGLPGVDVLGRDSWVGVPGPWAEFRCRWRIAVDAAGPLTEPDALRDALVTVLARNEAAEALPVGPLPSRQAEDSTDGGAP